MVISTGRALLLIGFLCAAGCGGGGGGSGGSGGGDTPPHLESGDRHLALSQCLVDGTDLLGGDESLQQLLYDAAHDRLLVIGDHLTSYDLANSSCALEFRWIATRSLLAVRPIAQEQLIATTLGALVNVDLPSREVVIISK